MQTNTLRGKKQLLIGFTRQFRAKPASAASSMARRFSTGSVPGSPMHTGQTSVLGGAP